MGGRWSLRTRLLILIGLALAPAAGLAGYTMWEQRRLAAADAKDEARRLATLLAADAESLIDRARHLLLILARGPAVRQHGGPSRHS
jgi:uncharacterized iron-regulated membrane protein